MKRTTIAILVLAGGMLGAFLIARLASPSADSGRLALTQGGADNPSFAFGNNGTASGALSAGELSATNLTEQVIRRYGEEILRLNTKGSAANGVVLPTDGVLENLIADAVEQPLTFPSFTSRDIKLIPLGGKEGLSAYLTTIVEVQNERLGNNAGSLLGAIAKFVSEEDPHELEGARNDMRTYVGDLLKISVPSPLTSFHVGLLNLWEKRAMLADAILKSGDDPLKVVASVEYLSQTASEETELVELLAASVAGLQL